MLLSTPDTVFNRILLKRMKQAVDLKLRDEQVYIRQNRFCVDQIASLCITMEQSQEQNSLIYINFIDYEKALDRSTMLKVLKYHENPEKITGLMKSSYEETNCRVNRSGQLSNSFEITTRIWLDFLFLLVVDWILKTSTKVKKAMEYSGQPRMNKMIEILLIPSHSCHTTTSRQRTRTNVLQQHHRQLGGISTRRKHI